MTPKHPTNPLIEEFIDEFVSVYGRSPEFMDIHLREHLPSLLLKIVEEALPEPDEPNKDYIDQDDFSKGFNMCRRHFLTSLKKSIGMV